MDEEVGPVADDFLGEFLRESADDGWSEEIARDLGKRLKPSVLVWQALLSVHDSDAFLVVNVQLGRLVGVASFAAAFRVEVGHSWDSYSFFDFHVDSTLEMVDTLVTLRVDISTFDEQIELLLAT